MDLDALCPCKGNFYRTFGQIRKQRGVMLDTHVFLASEASAYDRSSHPYLLMRQAQSFRTLLHRLVYSLISRIYPYHTAVIHQRDRCLRFKKSMFCKRERVMVCNDVF